MRNETIRANRVYLFPYEMVSRGEEIILYGFGNIGRQYYGQIMSNDYCRIKYIVDSKFESIRNGLIEVKSRKVLEQERKSRIIIALLNGKDEVLDYLNSIGYPKELIVDCLHSLYVPVSNQNEFDRTADRKWISMEEIRQAEGEYALEYLRFMRQSLAVYSFNDGKLGLERVGLNCDGGYLMINDIDEKNVKIAYSFGISDDVSWDNEMANRGYDVYMYDHTIKALPYERSEFHYFKKGISSQKTSDGMLDTMDGFLKYNGHSNIKGMLLKMDVEGAEWEFINETSNEILDSFDQIIMECHGMLDFSQAAIIRQALSKLSITHMPVHVHANNMSDVYYIDEYVFADCLEITFANRRVYSDRTVCEQVILPTELDSPCWPEVPEVCLNSWNKQMN